MKKRMLSKALVLLVIFSLLIPPAHAAEEEGLTSESPALTGAVVREGNLLKITTDEDFEAGVLENLEPADIGNGALALAEGADTGTFYSAVYQVEEYDSLRDEGTEYAMRLRAAGVPVSYHFVKGSCHGFDEFFHNPVSERMVKERIAYIKASFGPA